MENEIMQTQMKPVQEMGGQMPNAGMQMMGEPNMGMQMPVQGVAAGQFQTGSLYVGDLHPDVTESALYEIFNAVGPVASIRVCRDALTRRSLGYAYVNYHNGNDAERALETMNYTMIKDRPCRIMWSQRDPSLRRNGAGNVFVKHLDLSIDNKALYDTFSLFGNILSCKVVTDEHGKSKGYGFVHFETPDAADEAIKKINGMLIAGKEVFVGRFLKKNDRPSAKDWTNIYAKNIPKSWNKEDLEAYFDPAGLIASAMIMVEPDGKSRGFGFVDFVDHEDAVKAVKMFDGQELDMGEGDEEPTGDTDDIENEYDIEKKGEDDKENAASNGDEDEETGEKDVKTRPKRKPGKLILSVCRAQKKTERERELARKFEEIKLEKAQQYQGVNLYVKNLDDRVDDDILRKEFEPCGEIQSAKVMRDKPAYTPEGKKLGQSKGFGFVCFSTPEEAIKAVTEMNNKLIFGKPLYVALAQRKEQRRAQLEAQHRQQQRMMSTPGMGAMSMQGGMFPFNTPMNQQMQAQAMQGYGRVNPQMMQGMNPTPRGPVARGVPQQFPQGRPAQMPNQMGGQPLQGMGPQSMGPRPGSGMPNVPRGPMMQGPGMRAPAAMAPKQPGPGRGGLQFNSNARNTAMGIPSMQNPQMGRFQQAMAPQINLQQLANMNPDDRKAAIGELLYPLVRRMEPDYAGKITGMLLDLDHQECLHLLESPEALAQKVRDALEVLHP